MLGLDDVACRLRTVSLKRRLAKSSTRCRTPLPYTVAYNSAEETPANNKYCGSLILFAAGEFALYLYTHTFYL